ncbi:hypothetical protein F53441_11602 [Fusarium austroafricanum]|uniref:N-acetyltransferase domain-containing protein n=1 Tax=Fusarium austroafricanum TaxID=2364996 RepID=A0A8H4K550_9HYPO|nr:hypothetical protein F53441_11602 [Fusarium austroafricanum]
MARNASCKVQMRPVGVNRASIRAVAQVISLSFAPDPLIRWLLRNRSPGWESLDPTLQQWQEARLREYATRGIAMEAMTMDGKSTGVGSFFLFPPKPQYRWLNPSWWPTYPRILWDEWWVKPMEPFGDLKRIELMLDAHNAFDKKIRDRYPPNSLYYLEIAAVKPDTQGMGVGKAIMQSVIQRIGNSGCFLECTNKDNIGFYEKYGFELVDEQTLVDDEDMVILYYMVRPSLSKKTK